MDKPTLRSSATREIQTGGTCFQCIYSDACNHCNQSHCIEFPRPYVNEEWAQYLADIIGTREHRKRRFPY